MLIFVINHIMLCANHYTHQTDMNVIYVIHLTGRKRTFQGRRTQEIYVKQAIAVVCLQTIGFMNSPQQPTNLDTGTGKELLSFPNCQVSHTYQC